MQFEVLYLYIILKLTMVAFDLDKDGPLILRVFPILMFFLNYLPASQVLLLNFFRQRLLPLDLVVWWFSPAAFVWYVRIFRDRYSSYMSPETILLLLQVYHLSTCSSDSRRVFPQADAPEGHCGVCDRRWCTQSAPQAFDADSVLAIFPATYIIYACRDLKLGGMISL